MLYSRDLTTGQPYASVFSVVVLSSLATLACQVDIQLASTYTENFLEGSKEDEEKTYEAREMTQE